MEPPPAPPRDTTAPWLRFVSPLFADPRFPERYDRDSNGLMEVELAWSDSGGRIEPSTLRLIARPGVSDAATDTNLARGWRQIRLDSAGALFEETIPLMLPGGNNRLVASIADTAGNVAVESLHVGLAPAAFHRTIDLAYPGDGSHYSGFTLALTRDGTKGVVPFDGVGLAVFDPDGEWPTRYIHPSGNCGWVSLDTATDRAYLGGGACLTFGISVYDIQTEQYLGGHDVGLGVAGVFVHGQRIYAGEACTNGRIIVLDKDRFNEIGRVEPGYFNYEGPCPNSIVRSMSSDGRVGWAKTPSWGVMSFDASTFAPLEHFDLEEPPGDSIWGYARDVRLYQDRYLYLARLEYGLDERDLVSGTVRHYSTPDHPSIRELAIAPNGGLLFVSASPAIAGPNNIRAPLLFSIPGLQLRWAFAHRPGAVSGAAVWHPDGKRVFVNGSFDVDVYLVRP